MHHSIPRMLKVSQILHSRVEQRDRMWCDQPGLCDDRQEQTFMHCKTHTRHLKAVKVMILSPMMLWTHASTGQRCCGRAWLWTGCLFPNNPETDSIWWSSYWSKFVFIQNSVFNPVSLNFKHFHLKANTSTGPRTYLQIWIQWKHLLHVVFHL